MTIHQMEIFYDVAHSLNMSETSQKFITSQTFVSKCISSIEKRYDILLFERLSGRLFLTVEGKKLLTLIEPILLQYRKMQEFLTYDKDKPFIRIGVTSTVSCTVLGPILGIFKGRVPGVDLQAVVSTTDVIEEKLNAHKIDIGLVGGIVSEKAYVRKSMISNNMFIVCSSDHPFAVASHISMKELSEQPLILRGHSRCIARVLLETEFAKYGYSPKITWECNNFEAIIQSVMNNFGVSLLPYRLIEKYIDAGALCVCTIENITFNKPFELIYLKDKYLSYTIQQFILSCEEFQRQSPTCKEGD